MEAFVIALGWNVIPFVAVLSVRVPGFIAAFWTDRLTMIVRVANHFVGLAADSARWSHFVGSQVGSHIRGNPHGEPSIASQTAPHVGHQRTAVWWLPSSKSARIKWCWHLRCNQRSNRLQIRGYGFVATS